MRIILALLLTVLPCFPIGLGNPGHTAAFCVPTATPLFSGLTHAYKFEEASYANREDAVGSLDFTDGGAAWDTQVGKSGNCATNATASFSLESSATQFGTTWSIAFWFCHTYSTDNITTFTQTDNLQFIYDGGGAVLEITGGATLSGGTAASGVWNHVAATLSGGTATLYVNGSQVDSDTTTFPDGNNGLIIVDLAMGKQFAIDELYIWNRAISAANVTTLQTTFYTP